MSLPWSGVVAVLSGLLALLLLATGGGKLTGAASSSVIRDSLGLSPAIWRAIGVVEMLLVVGLLAGFVRPGAGRVALVGVGVLMVGALAARLRAGGTAQRSGIIADAIVLAVAGVALAL